VKALVTLEKSRPDLLAIGIEVLDDVQKLMEAGAARSVRVKFGGRTVAEYPVALTAAAAFIVGVAAVLVSKCSIEIEREEGGPQEQA
jgi:hypothetical protein